MLKQYWKFNWGQININFQSKGLKAKGGRQ
jgi:hypothetical protein